MEEVLNLGEGLNKVVEERNERIASIKSYVDSALDGKDNNLVIMFTTSPIGKAIIGISNKYEVYQFNHKVNSLDTLNTGDLEVLYNLLLSGFYKFVEKEEMFAYYRTMWHFNDESNWNDMVLFSCGYKAYSLIKDIINPLQEDKLSILSKYLIHFCWFDLFNKEDSLTMHYPIEITSDKVVMCLNGNYTDEEIVEFALHCNKCFPSVYNGESDYCENDYGWQYPNSLTLFFTDEAKAILNEVSKKKKDVFPIKGTFHK